MAAQGAQEVNVAIMAGDAANSVVNEVNAPGLEGDAPGNNEAPDQEAAPPPADAAPGAGAHADDREFLDKMRGWLMTVATLFVNMAFEAMLHPPEWLLRSCTTVAGPPSCEDTARVPRYHGNPRAALYMVSNLCTFAIALTLVHVLLLKTSKPRETIVLAAIMVFIVSLFLALVFALGTSESWGVIILACVMMVVYAAEASLGLVFGRERIRRYVAALSQRLMGR